MSPEFPFKSCWLWRVFFPISGSGVSAVNFCDYRWEPESSSRQLLQICCCWQHKFVRSLPTTHRLWEDRQLYILGARASAYFLNLFEVCRYKFQNKFRINELLLYLDKSLYIVFIFKTDAQSEITSLLIHLSNKY